MKINRRKTDEETYYIPDPEKEGEYIEVEKEKLNQEQEYYIKIVVDQKDQYIKFEKETSVDDNFHEHEKRMKKK